MRCSKCKNKLQKNTSYATKVQKTQIKYKMKRTNIKIYLFLGKMALAASSKDP